MFVSNVLRKPISSSSKIQCRNIGNVLEDVKIIDLTRIIAGPFCSMVLSDLGAEVVKVEKPGVGDECRKWGPPYINGTSESCYFMSVNRNKKSICVDLKSTEGKDVIYALVEKFDVLIENYVPGTLDKLKLGYRDLQGIAPHLIYCSITGYGSEGPYSHKPGYDVIAASVGGLLNITGPIEGGPVKAGVAVTDLATGLYAHGAILAALLQRTKTGKGQKIDCNLLSTQIASLINIGSNYLNGGHQTRRWGTEHESLVPYKAFRTKDGYITICTGSDSQFREFCAKINRLDLADDPNYQTNSLRVSNRHELIRILDEVLEEKTNEEWIKIFENCSFPNGPVNRIDEVFNDPHVKFIGLVETLKHPKLGEVKVVGPPVKFSGGVNAVKSAPPLSGEHTDEVLEKYLGYSVEKIERLRKEKIVK